MLLWLLSASTFAQVSLGDLARQQRAAKVTKPAAPRVITNDDLVGVPGGQPGATDSTAAGSGTASSNSTSSGSGGAKGQAKDGKVTAAQSASSPVDAFKDQRRDFRARYAEQQSVVDRLTRELNVAGHDYDYQTTQYWSDAGTRLRDNGEWVKKRTQYEREMTEGQKKLTEAQSKLDQIREDARHAGLPESTFDASDNGGRVAP
jgi:hypothetical protein